MSNFTPDKAANLHNQLRSVACSLRDLATRIESIHESCDPSTVNKINRELKQIGWSALFVSSSLDSLVSSTISQDNLPGDQSQAGLNQEINTLHIALSYLTENLNFFKTIYRQTSLNPKLSKAIDRLANQLKEVADGCRQA